MSDFDDFHGFHPAPPKPNASLVDWSPCRTNNLRARVRAHTCDCSPIVYELCVANGLTYVRRSDWSTYPTSVMESERLIDHRAQELWSQIMRGEAR